jgi:dTDP-glucose 4,6-dehydratase
VQDSVSGFIAFAECDGTTGEVVNLGSSCEVSITQIVELVSKCLGKKIETERKKERIRPKKSEVERLFSDSGKAKELFDWNPQTDLVTGLNRTISWIEKNIERYKNWIYNI